MPATVILSLFNRIRTSYFFRVIDWHLDSLAPWLAFSSCFVVSVALYLFITLSQAITPKPHLAIFNTEALLAALKHPDSKPTIMSFIPSSANTNAILNKSNSLNTPAKRIKYQDYLIKWQNSVIASANAYIAKNGMPVGKVVVEVRVLPNGNIDSYKVLESTNKSINPAITQILLQAAPYPKLPRQLARQMGVVIDRTWNFT